MKQGFDWETKSLPRSPVPGLKSQGFQLISYKNCLGELGLKIKTRKVSNLVAY